jgi:hypothetical protein
MGDPSGTTTYAYDTRNRLTSKVTPFGTLSYTFDAAGNLLTLKSSNSGGASDTYTYDQLNRLATVTDASGATTYAYDAVGNLQNFSYPNGVTAGGPAFEPPKRNQGGCPALAFCARAGTMLLAAPGLACHALAPPHLHKRGSCESPRSMRPWYPPLQSAQGWGTLSRGDFCKNQRVGHPPE